MTRLQHGRKRITRPLWLRLFAIFCMVLIGVGSTVQVCHAHVDSFEASLLAGYSSGPAHAEAANDTSAQRDSDASSAVNCPLCVAMHSALPVADTPPQMAMVTMTTMTPLADDIARVFSWRFEMASRPPPAELSQA